MDGGTPQEHGHASKKPLIDPAGNSVVDRWVDVEPATKKAATKKPSY
jgi:hypothetical protein